MRQLLLTTTGTLNPVDIDDLGAVSFPHPTVNFDLLLEWTAEEIENSLDLEAAVSAGHITLTDENGNNYDYSTDLFTFSVGSITSSTQQYYWWCANSNVPPRTHDQDLYRESNALTNLVPYIAPYNSEIILIMGKHTNGGNWDATLLVNNVIQYSLDVDNAVNNNPKFADINVSVTKGDEVRLRFRNSSEGIDYPQICVIGKKV